MKLVRLITNYSKELLRLPQMDLDYKFYNLIVFLFFLALRYAIAAVIVRWSLGSVLFPESQWTFKQILQLTPIIIIFQVSYHLWCMSIEDAIHEFFDRHFDKVFDEEIKNEYNIDKLNEFEEKFYEKSEGIEEKPRTVSVENNFDVDSQDESGDSD